MSRAMKIDRPFSNGSNPKAAMRKIFQPIQLPLDSRLLPSRPAVIPMNRIFRQPSASSSDASGEHFCARRWSCGLAAIASLALASCADNSSKDSAAELQAAIGKANAAAQAHSDEIASLKEKIAALEKKIEEKPSAPAPVSAAPPPVLPKPPPDETPALKTAAASLETQIKAKLADGESATVAAPVQMAQVTISKEGKVVRVFPVALEKSGDGSWKPAADLDSLLADSKKQDSESEQPQGSGLEKKNSTVATEEKTGEAERRETDNNPKVIDTTRYKWITTPDGNRKLISKEPGGEADSSSAKPEGDKPPQAKASSPSPLSVPVASKSSSSQSLPSPAISGGSSAPTFKRVEPPSAPVQIAVPKPSGGSGVPGHWSGPPGARVWVPAAPAAGTAETPPAPK